MGVHKPRTLSGECANWLRVAWFFLHAEGLSFKKTVLPAEQSRRDIAFKHARWKADQHKLDPRRVIFIDEAWIKTNMAPLRGWSLRGQHLDARVVHGHWKTLTFIAALRHDRIEAPWVIDGPINGEPAYSPDLNPIEQLFAKLKHLMRQPHAVVRKVIQWSGRCCRITAVA